MVTFNEEILSGKLHFLFSEKKNTLLDKKLHEGCVCVVYHNATYSFEELLKKKQFCLITLQKYASLGYRKVQSLQEDIPKNYDGGLSTEPTFKL